MARDIAPDWILQQTLSVQHDANRQWSASKGLDDGLTLAVLGCGTMGVAILGGIMDSLSSSSSSSSEADTPSRLPSKFLACVRRPASASRVKDALGKYDAALQVFTDENLPAVQAADVVLLGCKPYMVSAILSAPGIKEALQGKLLISILAGVPEAQIYGALGVEQDYCTVVRAMPNTAAAVRESMTVVGLTSPPLAAETERLVNWMFTRIGRVVTLPAANMDACTALCGSGPAFVALFIESLAAGAIAMGVPREEAYTMAAQTARGTTGLLQSGEHPAVLRDKVTTPGGCTIGGLLVLEEGAVRGTVARAVREATVVASQLGQGKQGVNGTRH